MSQKIDLKRRLAVTDLFCSCELSALGLVVINLNKIQVLINCFGWLMLKMPSAIQPRLCYTARLLGFEHQTNALEPNHDLFGLPPLFYQLRSP